MVDTIFYSLADITTIILNLQNGIYVLVYLCFSVG